MKVKYYFFYWIPVYLYAALIFYISSRADLSPLVEPFFKHTDKILHIFEFGFLCFLIIRALAASIKNFSTKQIYCHALIFSIIYGIMDEVHQSFVPGRTMTIPDIIADIIGCVAIIFILHKIGYIHAQRKKAKSYRTSNSH